MTQTVYKAVCNVCKTESKQVHKLESSIERDQSAFGWYCEDEINICPKCHTRKGNNITIKMSKP